MGLGVATARPGRSISTVRAYGLPRVISGSNSLWSHGYGDPAPEAAIVVGFDRQYAGQFFHRCEQVGRVTNRYGVKNEETTWHTGLYVCRQPPPGVGRNVANHAVVPIEKFTIICN